MNIVFIKVQSDSTKVVLSGKKEIANDYVALFSNANGDLLVWEPVEHSFTTKKSEKEHYQQIVKDLSCGGDKHSLLAFGSIRLNNTANHTYNINVGDTVIGTIEYSDDTLTQVNQLQYKPKFEALLNLKGFL